MFYSKLIPVARYWKKTWADEKLLPNEVNIFLFYEPDFANKEHMLVSFYLKHPSPQPGFHRNTFEKMAGRHMNIEHRSKQEYSKEGLRTRSRQYKTIMPIPWVTTADSAILYIPTRN